MLSFMGTALGALAILLSKEWVQQQIKERGWAGVVRSLGDIGTVMFLIHLAAITVVSLYPAITYMLVGYPPPLSRMNFHVLGLTVLVPHFALLLLLFCLPP